MSNIHKLIKDANQNAITSVLQKTPEAIHQIDEKGFPPLILASYL